MQFLRLTKTSAILQLLLLWTERFENIVLTLFIRKGFFAISVLRWSSLYLSLLFWSCSDFYHLPLRHYDVNRQLYVKLLSKESVEICLGPQKQQLTLLHFLLQKIAETDFSRNVLNVVLIEPLQPDFARIIFYTAK